MAKKNFKWSDIYKGLYLPLPFLIIGIIIGYFHPLGALIAGISIFIIFFSGGLVFFFIIELEEERSGEEYQTSKKIVRQWKNFVRYMGGSFVFIGLLPFYMIFYAILNNISGYGEFNEYGISFLILFFSILILGIFMLLSSFRIYKTRPTETPSSSDNTAPLEDGRGCPTTIIDNADQKWLRTK
jgi:hypothetical protein